MADQDDDTTTYQVVVNHEEQYSIWADGRLPPLGWRVVGFKGPKADCLEHISKVWTDMRPLSLRKKMEADAATPLADEPPPAADADHDDLIQRLLTGKHPVEVVLHSERIAPELKRCIDRQYVHVRFTDTQGGTELGVHLDPAASSWDHADFAQGSGPVHLEGKLTLNYVKVRCIADIDLQSLAGHGYLVPAEA